MRTHRALLLTTLLAGTLAGCGVADPYEQRRYDDEGANAAPSTTVAGEQPSTVPAAAPVNDESSAFPGAGATPEATLRHAATLAGNWTSESAPAIYGQLAALSVGDARAQFEQVAAAARSEVGADARATASVVAVDVQGDGARRRGVVVTRERVTGPDVPIVPAEHRVTLARIERRGDVWVVADWRPQP